MKKNNSRQVKDQNIIASINQNLYSLAQYLENCATILRSSSDLKNAPVAD